MRCGWGPYFRRTFEVQAGNSPLQGQSKPPAKLVVLIWRDRRYQYPQFICPALTASVGQQQFLYRISSEMFPVNV